MKLIGEHVARALVLGKQHIVSDEAEFEEMRSKRAGRAGGAGREGEGGRASLLPQGEKR